MVKWRSFSIPLSSPGITLPIGYRHLHNRQCASIGIGRLDTCEEHSRSYSQLSKNSLFHLKTKALRNRVWFRVLSRIERGLLDLTIGWVDHVKSTKLAKVLDEILTKLMRAMNYNVLGALQIGTALAQRISEWASDWGNNAATEWGSDPSFQ